MMVVGQHKEDTHKLYHHIGGGPPGLNPIHTSYISTPTAMPYEGLIRKEYLLLLVIDLHNKLHEAHT